MAGDPATAAGAALDRLAPEGALGVAVSGGGDSTALLVLAADWARARGRRIEAATVDHGLRPESAAEAAAVATLAARLGVPHQTLMAPDLRAEGGNLSAAARDARLALIGAWARARGLAAVALGHTIDDQAETVLMRLARGSGAEGLSAMAPARSLAGTLWLRPLLKLRRGALREVLEERGIGWVEDPTNEAPEYDRVKARRALAALAPLGIAAEGLAETAARLQRQRRVLERAMGELANRARRWGPVGEAWLDLGAMTADEPDTALRLLADTLMRVSGAPYRPRFRALSALWERLQAEPDCAATLSGCLLSRRGGGAVLLCREPAACQGPVPLAAAGTVWDGRWRLAACGVWPAGAVVGALGMPGLAALGGLVRERTLVLPAAWAEAPRAARTATPAIWEGPILLAAPLAGFVDRSRIGPDNTAAVENIAAGELRSPGPATYGPPGGSPSGS